MTPINREALIAALNAQNSLQPMLVIEWKGEWGIAMLLGEQLSNTWRSGDLIIFWDDGDQTDLDENHYVNVFGDPLTLAKNAGSGPG